MEAINPVRGPTTLRLSCCEEVPVTQMERKEERRMDGEKRGEGERNTQPVANIQFFPVEAPNMGVRKFSCMFQPQQIVYDQKNHPAELSSHCGIVRKDKIL